MQGFVQEFFFGGRGIWEAGLTYHMFENVSTVCHTDGFGKGWGENSLKLLILEFH